MTNYNPELYQRLMYRRAQKFAYLCLLAFASLAAWLIQAYYQQTVELIAVPDLKLCELRDVYCGVYEPVELAPRGATGDASYYDYQLDSGWSSLGHRVAASRDLPRYSYAKVTNIENGKSVVVKITDYGPDASIFPERIIDLSSYAFSQIAPLHRGVVPVIVEPYYD